MIEMTCKVSRDGHDDAVVKVDSRDVVVWEKTNKGRRGLSDLKNGVNGLDVYALAWAALQRTQAEIVKGLTRDEFEALCVVDTVSQDEVDPTQ